MIALAWPAVALCTVLTTSCAFVWYVRTTRASDKRIVGLANDVLKLAKAGQALDEQIKELAESLPDDLAGRLSTVESSLSFGPGTPTRRARG